MITSRNDPSKRPLRRASRSAKASTGGTKMTFLENLEPLLKAAEEYAKAVAALEPQQLIAAEAKLHEAAVRYAKWGKA